MIKNKKEIIEMQKREIYKMEFELSDLNIRVINLERKIKEAKEDLEKMINEQDAESCDYYDLCEDWGRVKEAFKNSNKLRNKNFCWR